MADKRSKIEQPRPVTINQANRETRILTAAAEMEAAGRSLRRATGQLSAVDSEGVARLMAIHAELMEMVGELKTTVRRERSQ